MELIKLLWFNIRMRVVDWCYKPEDQYIVGWEWVKKVGNYRTNERILNDWKS